MTDNGNPIVLMKRRRPGKPNAGTWATDETTRKPKDTVIGCPACGEELWLDGFEIARRGEVKPTLACPFCEFSQDVKLGEWSPPRGRAPRFRNDYPQE